MNINSKILVSLLCITVSARTQQETPVNSPQPAPEMRSLAKAFEGKWRISEKYEPDEWTPKGGEGHGEEVWRSGPGGFTLMEEFHDQSPARESFGLALTWWNKTKGFQGMWCVNANPNGCDLESAVAGFGPKWDGKRLVVDTEFFRGGKKFAWHEVFSDITATSFTQTADIGEAGGPLKRWETIRATKVPDASIENKETTAHLGSRP